MENQSPPLIEYCLGLANEFEARMDRMGVFVKNHNVSLGSSKEAILREFLSQHTPKSHHVGQGFMHELLHPGQSLTTSKQCDILIFDEVNFPLIYSDGPVKVVYPDSVDMVIEVKTNFRRKEVKDALENIMMAKQLKRRFSAAIFAFTSPSLKNVLKNLEECIYSRAEFGPVAIFLFDKGIIIHCWHYDLSKRADWGHAALATYKVERSKRESDRKAVVVAFLLLLFFEATAHRMSAAFTTALGGLLLNWTEEIDQIQVARDSREQD